jgi:hypothetical protein
MLGSFLAVALRHVALNVRSPLATPAGRDAATPPVIHALPIDERHPVSGRDTLVDE